MRKLSARTLQSDLEKQLDYMVWNYQHLYVVAADKDLFWEAFQNAFPEGENELYKERRAWDCQCCKHWFTRMAHVVAVDDDNRIVSIWDFKSSDPNWQVVVDKMSEFIHSCGNIQDVFIIDEERVGVPKSIVETDDGTLIEFHHLYLKTPTKFFSRRRRNFDLTIESRRAKFRDRKNVLKRSLDEIPGEVVSDVLDLINEGNLYRGEEHKEVLEAILEVMREYAEVPEERRDAYTWKKSYGMTDAIARVRNHAIGTLLVNLSEGMDIDTAVKKYEAIVAPENYKRPKPIFTKAMLEKAKETIRELGLEDSLGRRYATLDDITVNNILFANRDAAKRIKGGDSLDDIFADMEKETTQSKPMNFANVQEITIQEFLNEVLPEMRSVSAYLENRHMQNMVSLIAPINKDAKAITKWGNNFGWAYYGNVTDSLTKQRVKELGGDVDADVRFSIQWNSNPNHPNNNDFDAHATEKYLTNILGYRAYELFFGNRRNPSPSMGKLDVDIIEPLRDVGNRPAVENIAYKNKHHMFPGQYLFSVWTYTSRGGTDGFTAEVEVDGAIYSYEYPYPTKTGDMVKVATVTKTLDGNLSIEHHLEPDSNTRTKQIWGLNTNHFIPVTAIMYSPNFWDKEEDNSMVTAVQGIGNRHFFFMLDGCVNPDTPNGFYNEFLKDELHDHRKVFEALGSKMKVNPSEDQLSGLGFSSTLRNDLVVKVELRDGSEKVMKIVF